MKGKFRVIGDGITVGSNVIFGVGVLEEDVRDGTGEQPGVKWDKTAVGQRA